MKSLKKLSLLLLFILTALIPQNSYAEDKHETTLYLFWGNGCPHCEAEQEFLPTLEAKYPELKIKKYEVWYDKNNASLLSQMAEAFDFDANAVPVTFIGDFKPISGFGTAETTGVKIEENIRYCIEYGCTDPGSRIGLDTKNTPIIQEKVERKATLPLLGEIDVAKTGILLFTMLIGTIDGFNACAMWVLTFLLSLLVYSGSRKRMLLIGGTFILISGVMYFIFIAGWMSAMIFAGSLKIIQVGVSILAIIFGLLSVKEYFWFKQGPSLTIPAEKKKKIAKQMHKLTKPTTSLIAAMGGVAVLAIGVNVIELLCTLGLPTVYSNILHTYNFPTLVNFFFLLVYVFFYMLDDLILFLIAIRTMSSKTITEKYGRLSKLLSGIVILALGIIMLVNPNLLMFG